MRQSYKATEKGESMLGFRTGKPELWSETEEEDLCLEEGGSSKKLPRTARTRLQTPCCEV